MKLKEKLHLLKRAAPKCDATGMLYRVRADLKGSWSRVTFHTLFVSSENTHLMRAHVFDSSMARDKAEWAAWFAAMVPVADDQPEGSQENRLYHIHRKHVLPGIALRTGKQWAVAALIGWIPDAKYKPDVAKVSKQRHKAKSSRRARG